MEVHIVSKYGSGTDDNVTLVEETSVGNIKVHYEDNPPVEYSRASIIEATSATGMSVTIVSQHGSGTDKNVKKIKELDEPNLYQFEYFDDAPAEYPDASITKITEE